VVVVVVVVVAVAQMVLLVPTDLLLRLFECLDIASNGFDMLFEHLLSAHAA
jgi:hypothetical protein